jgi:hypothetical protein
VTIFRINGRSDDAAVDSEDRHWAAPEGRAHRLSSAILSEGEVFTMALMAAAGKFADMTSFDQLRVALKRLISDIENGKDPLDLDVYWEAYGGLKSGKGVSS